MGEKGKDNGILMLLAPNEREIRIEVGYGLEPDLTDMDASRIIQKLAIPNFKNNNWQAGTLATVNGIVSHLGSTPYDARIEERAEKKKKLEEERAHAIAMTIKALTFVFLVVIALIIVLGPPAILIYRRGRRKVLREAIGKTIDDCEKYILAIRKQLDLATEKLDQLASEITKKEYSDAKLRLHMISDAICMNAVDLKSLSIEPAEDLRDLEIKYRGLDHVLRELVLYSPNAVIYNIEEKIRQKKEAREASLKLFAEIPTNIEKVRIEKIIDEKQITKAEEKLKEAKDKFQLDPPDWLAIYALLVATGNLLIPPSRSVYSSSHRSKPYSSSSHISSGRSSPTRSSRSSFGGFGGGRSGGGGASGSF